MSMIWRKCSRLADVRNGRNGLSLIWTHGADGAAPRRGIVGECRLQAPNEDGEQVELCMRGQARRTCRTSKPAETNLMDKPGLLAIGHSAKCCDW